MARHSKWSKVKHQKAVLDVKKGKIFTKHAKLIEVAARSGGDPNMNPLLRSAMDEARADNMPNDNIERAIKKGTGELKDAAQIEEVMYEGFGPSGVALYIQTLTDNRNRTIASLKVIVSKNGGSMGAAGSVGYLFKKMGVIEVPLNVTSRDESDVRSADEIELAAIDAGADDVQVVATEAGDDEGGTVEVYTDPQALMQVRAKLKMAGIKTGMARLIYVPQTKAAINDEATARKIVQLIEAIEADDDVATVYSNFQMSEEILEKLA